MKAHFRNHVAAIFLLAPAAVTLSALPAVVAAQTAAPEVFSFQVSSDGGLAPGARLQFTLQGTPRALASVRVRGAREAIPLNETARGVYTGRYIISRRDRIDRTARSARPCGTANLSVAANYSFPPDIEQMAAAAPQQLRIERFHMATQDRIEPGAELRFTLEGMPGASASVDLPGIASNVMLRETRPGHYEGTYVLRRSDSLDMSASIVATLRAGDRVTTSTLARPVFQAGPAPVTIQILSHSNNSQIEGSVTRCARPHGAVRRSQRQGRRGAAGRRAVRRGAAGLHPDDVRGRQREFRVQLQPALPAARNTV
jgi:hypothetical protein